MSSTSPSRWSTSQQIRDTMYKRKSKNVNVRCTEDRWLANTGTGWQEQSTDNHWLPVIGNVRKIPTTVNRNPCKTPEIEDEEPRVYRARQSNLHRLRSEQNSVLHRLPMYLIYWWRFHHIHTHVIHLSSMYVVVQKEGARAMYDIYIQDSDEDAYAVQKISLPIPCHHFFRVITLSRFYFLLFHYHYRYHILFSDACAALFSACK